MSTLKECLQNEAVRWEKVESDPTTIKLRKYEFIIEHCSTDRTFSRIDLHGKSKNEALTLLR